MRQRYLVTGGCGFIGSHLVDALIAEGCAVRVLDDLSTGTRALLPATAELIVGDIGDPRVIRQALREVDGCFHLAAIASVARSNECWLDSHHTNLSATVGLFEAACGAEGGAVPVVYASSAAVYGDHPELPLHEELPPRPLSPYGADKTACELHARAGARVRGLVSAGMRLFNVYGPRQRPGSPYSGVITTFADRVARGERLELHGDGEQTRDFVFVEDVTRALLAVMRRLEDGGREPRAEVYNVCSGSPTRVRDLADRVVALGGRPVPIAQVPARSGDIRHSVGSPARLAEAVGIRPGTGLDRGLARTVEWIGRLAGDGAEQLADAKPVSPVPP